MLVLTDRNRIGRGVFWVEFSNTFRGDTFVQLGFLPNQAPKRLVDLTISKIILGHECANKIGIKTQQARWKSMQHLRVLGVLPPRSCQ